MEKIRKWKHICYKIINKPSGHRFFYTYTIANKYFNKNVTMKMVSVSVGIVLFIIGLLLLIAPGPGLVFIILGTTLLCVASKRVAKKLDHLEKKAKEIIEEQK